MVELGRNIVRNPALCDGTPRREKGYRAFVETVGPEGKIFWQSPLLATEADAADWQPQA